MDRSEDELHSREAHASVIFYVFSFVFVLLFFFCVLRF